MKKVDDSIIIALACAVIAVAVSALAVLAILSLRDLDPTTLIRMSEEEPMAPLARAIDPEFDFVHKDAHYDGVYFYAIALDPFATKEAHRLIDLSPARYSHAGYGWVAWLFGLGRPENFPASLLLVGLLSIGGASAVASLIARQLGASPWGGLFVALNPGLVYSVSADTSEPLAALLLGLIFLTWRARRWVLTGFLSIALCLTKEIFLVAMAGFFAWRCLQWFRTRTREDLFPPLVAVAVGPIAWILWHAYLYTRFDELAFAEIPRLIYPPLMGWAESMTIASGLSISSAYAQQVGQISVPLLAASAALLALGIYKAARARNEFQMVYLFVAVFTFCYGPLQLVHPKDWLRLGSTALILLPAVLFAKENDASPGSTEASHILDHRDHDPTN